MERIAVRTDVLAFAHCQHVISRVVVEQGRQALRVELAPGLGPEAVFQKPTFVITSAHLTDGIIEADVLARRSRNALPVSKASAGLAYRITGSGQVFEAVYLRPMNGYPMKPTPPLDRQAVQYFAFPDASRSKAHDPLMQQGPTSGLIPGSNLNWRSRSAA